MPSPRLSATSTATIRCGRCHTDQPAAGARWLALTADPPVETTSDDPAGTPVCQACQQDGDTTQN